MIPVNRNICLSLVVLAATALALPAHARSDSAFMKDAAKAGASEVEASKLAQTKARRAEVKTFADTMISEHTTMAGELKQLAASKNVTLPDEASLIDKSKMKLIQAGDDDKFDDRYVKTFGVKAHEDTVKLFEEQARDSRDPEVKAFAQKALPNLRHHLEMARALDKGR